MKRIEDFEKKVFNSESITLGTSMYIITEKKKTVSGGYMEKVYCITVSDGNHKPEVLFYQEDSRAKHDYEDMINLRKKYAKVSKGMSEYLSDPNYDCSYNETVTTSSNGDELFSEERVFVLTESGGEYEDA